jgi:hypothetical protein
MSTAQSQYLRFYDAAGVTLQRWQAYHAWTTVTWASAQWLYQPFQASGITSGITGGENNVTIIVPATPLAVATIDAAISQAQLVELLIYSFDPDLGDATPQATQALVGQFNGEIVNVSSSLTELRVELGSSLSPIGAQIPPRSCITRLIGKGCTL